MKILILGHGRHGKDTAAEMLHNLYGYTFDSSSWAACKLAVYPVMRDLYYYDTPEQCYDDRHNYRQMWYELIAQYNEHDPSRLARDILARNDMYVGMRSAREYHASKHLFDVVLYVSASVRMPLDPTMHIPYSPTEMVHIDNNRDTDYMLAQLKYLPKRGIL